MNGFGFVPPTCTGIFADVRRAIRRRNQREAARPTHTSTVPTAPLAAVRCQRSWFGPSPCNEDGDIEPADPPGFAVSGRIPFFSAVTFGERRATHPLASRKEVDSCDPAEGEHSSSPSSRFLL